MPPIDVSLQERQRAITHMRMSLQQMQQPAEKAASMAQKVEEAAYNKATNKHEYMQFLQTSMKKAQAALQRQQEQQALQRQQAVQQQQHAAAMAQQAQQQQHAAALAQQQAQQHQAIAQQQAAVQAQFVGQPQYMQQSAAPQPQYMQQQAPPQYMQQQAPPQYMQQQASQQQYMRPQVGMPASQQAAYVQAPGQQQYVQQQYAQPQPAQPQYMQQQAQQQYMQQPQAQFMQQQPGQPKYMQQHAPPQAQQAHYLQQQPGPGQAGMYQIAPPVQQPVQQMPAQQMPAQQYVQQSGAGGYTAMQQYAPAGMPVSQAAAQAAAVKQQPGMQPRHVGPADVTRMPSFDDPEFGKLAAELFPDSAQAPIMVKQQPTVHQAPQPRYVSPQGPAPSVAESSAPLPGRNASPGGAGREASSRRPLQHDPVALQEYLRMHAAFNNPSARPQAIKDCERMLQFYRDTCKTQPQHAERMTLRAQRYTMILRLLMTDQPHQQIGITEQVLKLTKGMLRELTQFREMMKKTSQKLVSASSLPNSSGTAAASTPSPGAFLAMMESGDSDAFKLPVGLTGPMAAPSPAAAKPSPTLPAPRGAPPAANSQQAASAAASAAAEAARQQAMARQRQLAEANAEQQRRREAAAAAAAALPQAGPPRLLAAAEQARTSADSAAAQSGFSRLQKALQAAEQRQLAPSSVQGVSTPPLPDEVRRLVARERAAMEEAAADGSGAAVLTRTSGEARVGGNAGGATGAAPAAKRQRGATPEFGAAALGQPRQRSEHEARLVAECEEVAASLAHAMLFHVSPDGMDPASAVVTCMPKTAQGPAAPGGGRSAIKHQWQLLQLRVPPGYPAEAPTAVFTRSGQGSGGEAQAAAAARSQQLLDACRERFASALAAGPSPPRLQRVAQAWLDATRAVEALAGDSGSGEQTFLL